MRTHTNAQITKSDDGASACFSSYNYPDRFVRHSGFRANIDANVTNLADSQFRLTPGLADPAGVSFESTNLARRYLRHSSFQLYVQPADNATARADATYYAE